MPIDQACLSGTRWKSISTAFGPAQVDSLALYFPPRSRALLLINGEN
jgi:hypothetical protein